VFCFAPAGQSQIGSGVNLHPIDRPLSGTFVRGFIRARSMWAALMRGGRLARATGNAIPRTISRRMLGPPAQARCRAWLPDITCRNPVVPDGRFFSILPCFPNVPKAPIAPIQPVVRQGLTA